MQVIKNYFEDIKSRILEDSFQSQDSKYFIRTAFKYSFIPSSSFFVAIYSVFIFIQMNYSFFIANGFMPDKEFQSVFIDTLMSELTPYGLGLFAYIAASFIGGLGLSYFILRPFKNIQDHFDELQDNPKKKFLVDKISNTKLVLQAAVMIDDYIKFKVHKDSSINKFEIPENLKNISGPQSDKVFYMQYFFFIAISCLLTALALYGFVTQLNIKMVQTATSTLDFQSGVQNYFASIESPLKTIYMTAIALNLIFYVVIARSIIKEVEGVSFAFFRDAKALVLGDHKMRMRPRFKDPGRDSAVAINDYLDKVFPKDEKDIITENILFTNDNKGFNELERIEAEVDSFEDIDGEEINQLSMEHLKNVHSLDEKRAEQVEVVSDTPPPFIERYQVANGTVFYTLITPTGEYYNDLTRNELEDILEEQDLV